MSSIQKRSWLMLWSMCPAYCVYFILQIVAPGLMQTAAARIGCLAICAGLHAVIYLVGFSIIKLRERGESLLEDERDLGIDARATRVAYFIMLTGMIVVGVVMPFSDNGWTLINTAFFFIVLTEAVRHVLILMGYRGVMRVAH
jgi:uncharacterized membrane protein